MTMEEAIKMVQAHKFPKPTEEWQMLNNEAIDMAIEALTEDKADKLTGEWIGVTNGRGGHECSKCHAYAPSYMSGDEYLSNYCPSCGTKMKCGEDE